jgi:hypothetical protein
MTCFKIKNLERVAPERKEGFLQRCAELNKSTKRQDEMCFDLEGVVELHGYRIQNKQLPSVPKMIKSATQAVGQEIRAVVMQQPPVSEEEQQRRLEICRGCEFFTPNIETLSESKRKQERCIKCGCFMNFKAKLRSQHCPINRW